MDKHKFDVCSVDETRVMTVLKPKTSLRVQGVKQTGSLTSSEKGQHGSLCVAVSASGNSDPPFLVYPRAKFRDHFLNGAPPGSKGTAHPSGWMTADNFLLFLKHFVKHVKPTKDKPVLILQDNHDSHLSIDARLCQGARYSHVIIFTALHSSYTAVGSVGLRTSEKKAVSVST